MAGNGDVARIEGLIRKHLGILGERGPLPRVALKANLGSTWLGRHTYYPNAGDALMEVQREVLVDPETLERVVSHETVHHAEALAFTEEDRARIRLGIKPAEHGGGFRERAARINAVMGPGFVTVESDRSYKRDPKLVKDFFVLITPISSGRLGYQWAVRLSPEMQKYVEYQRVSGAGKLAATKDVRFTKGPKIKRLAGWAVPADQETQAKLASLYAAA